MKIKHLDIDIYSPKDCPYRDNENKGCKYFHTKCDAREEIVLNDCKMYVDVYPEQCLLTDREVVGKCKYD